MNRESTLIIEPLNSHHDRESFHCGNTSLDNYLQKQATQDLRRRINRVYVATDPDHPAIILGYYTLSTCSIELAGLPEALSRKLPRHPVPAALIGRLAVNQSVQRSGVGRVLLANAIRRTLAVSEQIGIHALLVDAIDDDARKFYEHFGFTLFQTKEHRLFLQLKSF